MEPLDRAREALAARRWEVAYAAYRSADGLDGDDLDALAEAAHWLGRPLSTVFAGDVLYREWTAIAEGVGRRIGDGIGTFVFRDGQIRVQTVRYTVQPIGQ